MRNAATLAWALAALAAQCLFGQAAPSTVLASASAALDVIELDPNACFRVRDIPLDRGDLRYYFTDGWLIFAKPVSIADGAPPRSMAAVFVRSGEADDAELTVLPPSTGERMSLARFTGTPNLSEHLDTTVMLFTDDTAADIRLLIAASNKPNPSPEQGLLLKARFDTSLHSLVDSFRLRLMENILNGRAGAGGFFYAAMLGRKLGNFDALYDPAAQRQVFLGQFADRLGHPYYDVWTAFPARALRNRPWPAPNYAITDNRINAKLAVDLKMEVTSTAKVNLTQPARVLVFDLSDRLRVSRATVDGQPAEVFDAASLRSNRMRSSEVSQFLVLPERELEPGRDHEVTFEYSGTVITQMGKDVFTVGSRTSWYPTNGIQFSRFDITFTHPETLDVVFPGDIKEQSVQNGMKRIRRVMAQPVRLAGFNVGRYESRDETRAGLTVTIYGNRDLEARLKPPSEPVLVPAPSPSFSRPGMQTSRNMILLQAPPAPDPLARLNPLGDEIASAFEYYAQLFGPPATPHLMVSPIPGTFGQGFPGLVYLSTIAYLDAADRPDGARTASSRLFFSETLHAHETAHQWWGNVVATSTEGDEWLMEALASYSSLMVLEKRKGPKELHKAFDQYRDHLLAPVEKDTSDEAAGAGVGLEGEALSRESAGPLRLGNRLDNSLVPGAWQAVIYEKGAWVIHMLRRRMGDAAFLKFLKDFVAQHRLQNVTTEEFFAAAAAALPKDMPDRKLETFMDSWVEGTGIPTLTLDSRITGKAPNLRLTLTVKQASVNDRFSTAVPVVVQFAAGKPRTIWLETGPDAATETISIPSRPIKVTLDPDGWVLRR